MSIEASVYYSALNLAGKSNICVYYSWCWINKNWTVMVLRLLNTWAEHCTRRWLWWHVSFSQWAVESVGSLEVAAQVLWRAGREDERTCQAADHDRAALRRDRRGSRCSQARCPGECAQSVPGRYAGPSKKMKNIAVG